MGRTFRGVINTDIRDSVPDWSPFEPPKAPEGAPSVVYIVLDDVGFSAMGCYGGPIETPNIERIAGTGVRYFVAFVPNGARGAVVALDGAGNVVARDSLCVGRVAWGSTETVGCGDGLAATYSIVGSEPH